MTRIKAFLRRVIPKRQPTEQELLVAFMDQIEARSEGQDQVWITESEWQQIGARVEALAGKPPHLSVRTTPEPER